MPKKSLVSGMEIWKELGAVTEDQEVQSLKEAKLIAISLIHPNPNQPRKSVNREALQELAESIRTQGLLQPIVVRPQSEGFMIIAGHRRYEACKIIGMGRIPCLVREEDEDKVLEQALVENIQREDINPVEEAQGYRALMGEHSYSIRDLASRVHKSVGYIHGRLELLKHEDLAQSVHEGQIGIFEARELAKVADEETRRDLTEKVASGELGREGLKQEIKGRSSSAQQISPFSLGQFSRHWAKMRQELARLNAGALPPKEQAITRQVLEEILHTTEEILARIQ